MVVRLGAVGIGCYRRERGNQPHGLSEVSLQVERVRILVVRVGRQHRAGDGVHQILTRRADDGFLLETVRQAAILAKDRLPLRKLSLRG